MSDFLAIVASGLVSGSSYALLALGIVIIFRSTDTVNFAIGDIATLAAFIASGLMASRFPAGSVLVVTILFSGILGVVSERTLIRPLGHREDGMFVALVITIGLGLLIHAGIFGIWGTRPRSVEPLVGGAANVFGIALSLNKIVAVGIALLAMLAVAWFFKATPFGTMIRATADDPSAARMIGIDTNRVCAVAWFLGCGLAGIAAFFLASEASLNANLTLSALFRAFAGVFLGGLTSMVGAVVGGLCIGVLDNLAASYVSASFRDTVVFTTIVIVLFLRPSGFLGVARKARV